MNYVGFKDYVKEILKTAEYRRDTETGCIVAVASVLPGCMTQGANFEEARDSLSLLLESDFSSHLVGKMLDLLHDLSMYRENLRLLFADLLAPGRHVLQEQIYALVRQGVLLGHCLNS